MNKTNTETEMKIAIPVSLEDHIFVENVCTNGGYTFKTFFAHCLNLYRKSLNEPLSVSDKSNESIKLELPKRKSGLTKKQ